MTTTYTWLYKDLSIRHSVTFDLFNFDFFSMVRADLEKPIEKAPLAVPLATFVERGEAITGINPNLANMDVDILYHLGQDTAEPDQIRAKFADVKVVAMGGSRGRVIKFAAYCADQLANLYPSIQPSDATTDLAKKAGRFVMFKVGPVLTLNHGMGFGCLSIALHETIKLLHYAGATDVSFIRMGTSGGLGVDPGNVILTQAGFDATLQAGHEITTIGKKHRYPAQSNQELNGELERACGNLDIPLCKVSFSNQSSIISTLCLPSPTG